VEWTDPKRSSATASPGDRKEQENEQDTWLGARRTKLAVAALVVFASLDARPRTRRIQGPIVNFKDLR